MNDRLREALEIIASPALVAPVAIGVSARNIARAALRPAQEVPMTGLELIAAERQRQIAEEGYDAAHDAGASENLAMAGASYAIAQFERDQRSGPEIAPWSWSWDARYWKPTPSDRVRELVKAGALIAAAIDAHLDGQRHR
jgi:hypothetical protein